MTLAAAKSWPFTVSLGAVARVPIGGIDLLPAIGVGLRFVR